MKKLIVTLVTCVVLSGASAFAGEGKDKCCCGKEKAECAACSDKDHPCEKCAKMDKEKHEKKS